MSIRPNIVFLFLLGALYSSSSSAPQNQIGNLSTASGRHDRHLPPRAGAAVQPGGDPLHRLRRPARALPLPPASLSPRHALPRLGRAPPGRISRSRLGQGQHAHRTLLALPLASPRWFSQRVCRGISRTGRCVQQLCWFENFLGFMLSFLLFPFIFCL